MASFKTSAKTELIIGLGEVWDDRVLGEYSDLMAMLFSRVFGAAILAAIMVAGTVILATPMTTANFVDTHLTAKTEGAMSWNGNLIQTACAVSVAKSLSQSALRSNDPAVELDKIIETCGAVQTVEALKAIRLPMASNPIRFELVAADAALND